MIASRKLHQGTSISTLYPSRLTRITPHNSKAPKSFFKALFIRTSLGTALKKMRLSKAFQDGLKPQEYKQGSGRVKLPIPYIPEKDELQEALEATANTIKLTLPGKVGL